MAKFSLFSEEHLCVYYSALETPWDYCLTGLITTNQWRLIALVYHYRQTFPHQGDNQFCKLTFAFLEPDT